MVYLLGILFLIVIHYEICCVQPASSLICANNDFLLYVSGICRSDDVAENNEKLKRSAGGGLKLVPDAAAEPPMVPFDDWAKLKIEEHSKATNAGEKLLQKQPVGPEINVKASRNYASRECGAKILASSPEAQNAGAVLNEKDLDEYMLNPCTLNGERWLVLELCESVQINRFEWANFELFSCRPKSVRVWASDRYPSPDWAPLGEWTAQDKREVHSFEIEQRVYGKFLKIQLLSHYGAEHFMSLTFIRVLGVSMVEEYEHEAASQHDQLEKSQQAVSSSKTLQTSTVENSTKLMPSHITPLINSNVTITINNQANLKDDDSKEPTASSSHPSDSSSPSSQVPTIITGTLAGQRIFEGVLSSTTRKLTSSGIFKPLIYLTTGGGGGDNGGGGGSSNKNQDHRSLVHQNNNQSISGSHSLQQQNTNLNLGKSCLRNKKDRVSILVKPGYENALDLCLESTTGGNSDLQVCPSWCIYYVVLFFLNFRSHRLCFNHITGSKAYTAPVIMTNTVQSQSQSPLISRESIFVRLNNRMKAVELNVSLSSQYLSQLSKQYRRQMEDIERAFNTTSMMFSETDERFQQRLDQLSMDLLALASRVNLCKKNIVLPNQTDHDTTNGRGKNKVVTSGDGSSQQIKSDLAYFRTWALCVVFLNLVAILWLKRSLNKSLQQKIEHLQRQINKIDSDDHQIMKNNDYKGSLMRYDHLTNNLNLKRKKKKKISREEDIRQNFNVERKNDKKIDETHQNLIFDTPTIDKDNHKCLKNDKLFTHSNNNDHFNDFLSSTNSTWWNHGLANGNPFILLASPLLKKNRQSSMDDDHENLNEIA